MGNNRIRGMGQYWVQGLVASAAGILSVCLGPLGANATSENFVGTLTQISGDVQLYSHPSKKLQKEAGTHALYEGEYYLVEPAKAGLKLEQGNIVRAAPGAKARVVYDNGDQMYVGSGTALRVFWDKEGKTRVDLAYGKLRGVIEKGGPRSKLQIRTKTATMGVRGTDFFVADGGSDGGTEVSILRGAVEVKPKAPEAKPLEVKQGFSVSVAPPAPVAEISQADAGKPTAPAKLAPVVELRQTTQEELQGIQKSSIIARAPQEAPAPEIARLEKKAVETTLKDIQTHDPKLFAQLKTQKVTTVDDLNGSAVQVMMKEAPRAPERRKPFKSEIEDLEQGAYEKYFKLQE